MGAEGITLGAHWKVPVARKPVGGGPRDPPLCGLPFLQAPQDNLSKLLTTPFTLSHAPKTPQPNPL